MMDMKNEFNKLQLKLKKEGFDEIANQLKDAKKIEDNKNFKVATIGLAFNMTLVLTTSILIGLSGKK